MKGFHLGGVKAGNGVGLKKPLSKGAENLGGQCFGAKYCN